MLKISGPVGAALFVTAILAAGAGAGLSIGSARADDCLAAPKGAAPQGQHWYYHIDRATRRKCWYLHGAMPLHHRAAMQHQAATTPDSGAEAPTDSQAATAIAPARVPPAPATAAPAPAPDSTAAATPTAPHVTVLTVKTVTPFVGTTALPSQNAPGQNTSGQAPAPSVAQPPLRDGDTPALIGSANAANVHGAAPQRKADAAFGASMQTSKAATDAAKTRTAEGFILLAAAFGVAAALTAIVSKIVGIYRTPRISVDPDAAWVEYRSGRRQIDAAARHESGVPFVDPQEHYGLGDLHAQEWLDRSAPDQDQSSAPRTAESAQPQSPRPILGDIEAALQVLRQARQSRVA